MSLWPVLPAVALVASACESGGESKSGEVVTPTTIDSAVPMF